ncbi:MAG: DUF134 domain-containing protein [Candidatus Diapherotrites archaeon]
MPRPRMLRFVDAEPGVDYFKPSGIPLAELEEVTLSVEEMEALRLEFMEKMGKEDAAKKMGISRTTFWRVLSNAGEKVADALTNGKAMRIEGGDYEIRGTGRGARGFGRGGAAFGNSRGFGRGMRRGTGGGRNRGMHWRGG